MKKTLVWACALLTLVLLAACGGAAAPSAAQSGPGAPHGSGADYKAVIEAARPAELNDLDLYAVVSGAQDPLHDPLFSGTFGFVEEEYDEYAISVSGIITHAYGVAIILPKMGQEEAVLEQVNAFVAQQKKAMENYLQDQFEIASSALVKTAPTGEILLAMCEDAETVMANMESGLAEA